MKNKSKKINFFFFLILLSTGVLGLGSSVLAQTIIVEWTFPSNSSDSIADGGTEINLDKTITVAGATNLSFNNLGITSNSARATGWHEGSGKKYWQIEFNSEGYELLRVYSKQRSSDTGPRDFNLEYKIGSGGNWKSVSSGITVANDFTSGALNNLALPTDCDDQLVVYLRWVMSSNLPVKGEKVLSSGASNIDDIIVVGTPIKIEENEENQEESENEKEEKEECAVYSQDVKINEIFPYPESGGKEFVEIFNFGEDCVDVSGWKIMDKAGYKKEFPQNSIIEPEEYLYVEGNLYLNNDSDTVYLIGADEKKTEKVLDEVFYEKAKKGYSWSFDGENWYWTSIITPGSENEFDKLEEDKDEEDHEFSEYNIRLNEIFPNPRGEEKNEEYIEIYNGENFAINLEDWILKDSSKTKFVFPKDYIIESGGYLAVYRNIFKFALNNSGKESVYLLDPDGNEISSAEYENSKENVSYNFNGKLWKWSRFLTPGKENKFNSTPKVKIEKIKNAYAGMPVFFSAKVKDGDKDKLKFIWNFGNGKRSYLQETFHNYKKKGKYLVSLSVDDGSEKITKEFKLEVKKYPSFKVEIVRLLPNPSGLDSGNEWIEIKNNENKKINLKGWKIATGTERLINHVIADDFEIDPGKTRRATRENSFFYLNNRAMKLELRYPSGKTADSVNYAKNKIVDGEIYEKTVNGWRWLKPLVDSENIDNEEAMTDETIIISNGESLSQIDISAELILNNDEELTTEFLDKQSENLSGKNKIREIIDYGLNIKTTELKFSDRPLVLGDSIVRVENNLYVFGLPHIPEKHWALKLMENTSMTVNYFLNKSSSFLF